MKILMLSSSREGNTPYLDHARPMITEHLGNQVKDILFIPFAGVTLGWDDYTNTVQKALPEYAISGIHQHPDAESAIRNAQAIAVGGGNTFNLLNELYKQNCLSAIRERVEQGIPYIGWSAGSNICGNSIRTTNDMPIVEPPSFNALNLVPFQLNPHYTDYQPPGHNGETRAQRLQEFMVLNPDMPVLAIREGSALLREGEKLTLKGDKAGLVFLNGSQSDIAPGHDLSQYL